MKLHTALAAFALALGCGGAAAADAIIAKDSLGQEYQLSDDGTYAKIVRGQDGTIYLLAPTGAWYGPGEAKTLSDRFGAEFDKAMASGKGPSIDADKLPAYRTCVVAAFNRYPIEARRILMAGGEIKDNFEKLQKAMPEVATSLNKDDRKCRNG